MAALVRWSLVFCLLFHGLRQHTMLLNLDINEFLTNANNYHLQLRATSVRISRIDTKVTDNLYLIRVAGRK